MNKYQEVYQNNSIDDYPVLLETLQSHDDLFWEDQYWISRCLFEKASLNFDLHILIDALNSCCNSGLSMSSNRTLYLNARIMLSKLYSQLALYDEAVNNLGFLIDNTSNPPTELFLELLSAQICTNQLIAILRNPFFFFEDLHQDEDKTPDFYSRRRSIFIAFLNKSTDYLQKSRDKKVMEDIIRKEAEIFNINGTQEWLLFENAICEVRGIPLVKPQDETDELPTVIDIDFGDIEPKLIDERVDKLQKDIKEKESELRKLNERLQTKATKQEQYELLLEERNKAIAENGALLEKCNKLSSDNKKLRDENEGLMIAVKAYKEFTIGEQQVNNPCKKKILFYGASLIDKSEMLDIANEIGIQAEMLEIHDDYDKIKTRTFINKNSSRFLGVLVSASAHKAKDSEGESSPARHFIDILPTVEVKTSTGELKCTRESFKRALNKLYWDLVSQGLLEVTK